jgi:hypothetical protein
VALAATAASNGIVGIPVSSGAAAFAVSVSNVGVGGLIEVSADTGGAALPALTLHVCGTDSASGACAAPPAPKLTTFIGASATGTFGVFVS